MSLANWSDIIEICDDSYTSGSFRSLKRRKVSWAEFIKWQEKNEIEKAQNEPRYAVMISE